MMRASLVLGLLLAACSSEAPAGSDLAQEATSGEASSGLGAGGFSATSSGAGGAGFGGGCASETHPAQPLPVSMIIMLDKSDSMSAGNKWGQARAALEAFFQSSELAGAKVALNFFPRNDCSQQQCPDSSTNDYGGCVDPLVPSGQLQAASASEGDSQEAALLQIFNSVGPSSGGTPTFIALKGATEWAKDHADDHPDERVAVVFVTDGVPSACISGKNDIAQVAGNAHASHGIVTFAIGLEGANKNLLDAIADAGQTGQSKIISTENAEQELVEALSLVQQASVKCEFAMPESEEATDPNQVNVTFNDGSEDAVIAQVADAASCDAAGWYYDDPVEPTLITLCPATCEAVSGNPDGSVEILLGCPTVIP